MKYSISPRLAALGLAAAALLAHADQADARMRSFHTFHFSELYSNADGSVQFIEFHEVFNFAGQNFEAGIQVTASNSDGSQSHVFTFPSNLPSSATAGKRMLLATPGFAALPGGVTPDYIIPAGFLFPSGSVDYQFADNVGYTALPTNGQASLLFPGGTVQTVNSPTNFAGNVGSVNLPSGSCCIGAACTVTSSGGCAGTFTPGGNCSPGPCAPPPTGACCNATTCSIQTAAACASGSYKGDGSACGSGAGNPTTCCPANFNHQAGVSVQDIFDFLAAYFNGDLAADFNGVGGVSVQDIFDFLAAYFVGCPG